MKPGAVTSFGHSIAASIASGMGFMIGTYRMDVFAEAASSEPGFIELDIITGVLAGNVITPSLARAFCLYREVLKKQSVRQNADLSKVKHLVLRFGTDQIYGRHFSVKSICIDGQISTAIFDGITGQKIINPTA
ncbi:hypothetical protein GN316_05115 [Xylophilus sp. Kf1]|nr:hypothetical protein [Xylophilus sp. Kf1]